RNSLPSSHPCCSVFHPWLTHQCRNASLYRRMSLRFLFVLIRFISRRQETTFFKYFIFKSLGENEMLSVLLWHCVCFLVKTTTPGTRILTYEHQVPYVSLFISLSYHADSSGSCYLRLAGHICHGRN